MQKIRTTVTAGLTSLGLIVGTASLAGAASGTIGTTGPDSYNKVSHKSSSWTSVKNNNNVSASNNNNQHSSTGDARSYRNTTGGGASTGDASNMNALDATVSVENSAPSMGMGGSGGGSNSTGTINNTGPDSVNVVRTTDRTSVRVENNNNINVTNSSSQTATSGDASVSRNTSGGSASTGDATNSNMTTLDFSVSN